MLEKRAHTSANTERSAPTSRILLLSFISSLLFVAVVSIFQGYFSTVDRFGDNQSYMAISFAIRHWSFQDLEIKHFWGLPYVMAAVSLLTGASDRTALL